MSDVVKTVTVDCAPLCNEEHDLENEYRNTLEHVNHERTAENVVFEYQSLEGLYQEQFSEAVEAYNAKQKRPERQKTVEGYLQDLKENDKEYIKKTVPERSQDTNVKSRYEILLYVGDMHDTGYKDHPEDAKQAEEILTEYIKGFKERNPNMIVQYSYLHKDEATPHGGIVFVPVAEGYKTGLNRRVSMSKALEQQGFPDKRGDNGYERWIKGERAELKRLAEARGLTIIKKNDPKRDKMTTKEYKSFCRAMEQELKREPLKRLKKAEKGMFGYSKEDYERLYSEYIKLGDRCWKAERLLKDTAAMDKTKLEAENKELSQGVDTLLAAVDEKDKALAKSRALTKQAAGAFKIAVGTLSKSQANSVSQTLEKAGYNKKLVEVAGERVKEWERIEKRQSQQTQTLDLSNTRKSSGKTLKR